MYHPSFSGILLVVSIGVALGVFFGGILLTAVVLYMKRLGFFKRPSLKINIVSSGEITNVNPIGPSAHVNNNSPKCTYYNEKK